MRSRLISMAMLAACSSSSGGHSIALDDLGPELAKSSCMLQFECCTDAEIMAEYMGITLGGQPITTEAQCEQLVSGFFVGLAVTGYKASIAAGRIEYDADAAGACIDVANSLTCADANSKISCDSFIVPLVADGGGCTQDYECITDNCEGATVQPGGPNTDGTCKAPPALGQACVSACAKGAYCDHGQSGMAMCAAEKADGMSCTSPTQCTSNACSGDSSAPGTCGPDTMTCNGR